MKSKENSQEGERIRSEMVAFLEDMSKRGADIHPGRVMEKASIALEAYKNGDSSLVIEFLADWARAFRESSADDYVKRAIRFQESVAKSDEERRSFVQKMRARAEEDAQMAEKIEEWLRYLQTV